MIMRRNDSSSSGDRATAAAASSNNENNGVNPADSGGMQGVMMMQMRMMRHNRDALIDDDEEEENEEDEEDEEEDVDSRTDRSEEMVRRFGPISAVDLMGGNAASPPPPEMVKQKQKVKRKVQKKEESGHGGGGAAKYYECLKNHAASYGSHVVDGCGEFMPGGGDGSLEALRCAACGCHRNFHRRVIGGVTVPIIGGSTGPVIGGSAPFIGGSVTTTDLTIWPHPEADCGTSTFPHERPSFILKQHNIPSPSAAPAAVAPSRSLILPPPPPPLLGGFIPALPIPSSATGAAAAIPPAEFGSHSVAAPPFLAPFGSGRVDSRKRFRTKFTAAQKERMREFADEIGWRIQKHDEQAVLRFCAAVGVKRHVFKVWMHNNKSSTSGTPPPIAGGGIGKFAAPPPAPGPDES